MTGWCQSDGRVVSGRLLIGFLIGFSRWVVSVVSVCLSHLRGSQWPGGMPGGVSIENGGMARVDWDCARGVGNQGAINGAFDASFASEFCSTRRFLGALEPARAGSCENAVVHPVRIVEEKAEHDGQREASCDREKGRRKRVPFAWRVRMCWARLHCVELRMLMLRQT